MSEAVPKLPFLPVQLQQGPLRMEGVSRVLPLNRVRLMGHSDCIHVQASRHSVGAICSDMTQ